MEKALCWVSCDFDLTLTGTHTWKSVKIKSPTKAATAGQLDQIKLDGPRVAAFIATIAILLWIVLTL